MTTLIHFAILSYFEHIGNNGLILTVVIIIFMILSIIIDTRKICFNYFFVVILYECLLFFSNFLGIFLLKIFQHFDFNLTLALIIVNLLAKGILIFITCCILKLKLDFSLSLEIRQWLWVIIFEVLLIFAIVILNYELIRQDKISNISFILLLLLNILSFLFIGIIYKIHLMNLNIVEDTKLRQMTKFNQEKFDTIKQIKNDVDALEHRMIYVLLKIKYSIEKK